MPGRACHSCYADYLAAWEREHGPVETSIVWWRVPNDSTTADQLRDSAADVAEQILNMPGSVDPTGQAIDTALKMMTFHHQTRHLYGNGAAALRLFEAVIEAGDVGSEHIPEILGAAIRYEDFGEPNG